MKTDQTVLSEGETSGLGAVASQVFPLETALSSRIWAAVGLVLVVPWVLLALVGAIHVVPWIGGSIGAAIGAVAIFALGVWLGIVAYRLSRELFLPRTQVTLDANALVLRHPALLRSPLEIPLADIERVVVSTPASQGFWDPHGFTLEKQNKGITWSASDEETIEALDFFSRLFLPLASHVVRDEPNVAVILRTPVDMRGLGRKPVSRSDPLVQRLCEVRFAEGFFVRLKDPEAAAKAFDRLALVDKLDEQHVPLIEPDEEDIERFRQYRLRRILFPVAGFMYLTLILWNATHST